MRKKIHIPQMVNVIVFCTVYRMTLQYIYIEMIAPRWAYYGFGDDFSLTRCFISWILFVPVPYILSRFTKNETVSRQILSLFLLISYVPTLVLYIYMPMSYLPLFILYYLIFVVAAEWIKTIKFKFRVYERKYSDTLVDFIGILISVIIIFIWAFYAHFNLQISFTDIYTTRLEAREYEIPFFLNYIRAISRSIIPLLAIYNLYKRRKIKFIFYLAIQFILFSIDGTKTTIFVILAGIAGYYIVHRRKAFISVMPQILSAIGIAAILEKFLIKTTSIADMIVRRIMFLPCLQNSQYYEYFSTHGIDFYRQSLGGILGASQYNDLIARIIGKTYYGSAAVNANNGLFSDAYANLGIAGVLILPIMIIIVLKIMEGAGQHIPQEVWTVCTIQTFMAFLSSSFFTVLVTHGVIFICIMLYMLSPRQDTESFNSE